MIWCDSCDLLKLMGYSLFQCTQVLAFVSAHFSLDGKVQELSSPFSLKDILKLHMSV